MAISGLVFGNHALYEKLPFVSYEMFGAKLDGTTDDTIAIRKAHDYANSTNKSVIQKNGKIRISDVIEVRTDVDLRGCELIIDDLTPNKILYYLKPTEDYTTVTANKAEFYEGATTFSSLANYKNSIIKIDSDVLFATRGDGVNYNKQEMVVHISNGFVLGGSLQDDFTSGNVTFSKKSILDNPITFKCPKIVFKKTDMSFLNNAIKCTRSNVTVSELIVQSDDLPVLNSSVYKGALVSVHDCYNFTFKDITTENLSAKATTTTQPTYIMGVDRVVGLFVERLNCQRGWGVMGTHYVKNAKFDNCYLNRIDNHIGCGDFDINNCTLSGCYGIYLGWGKGTVTISNSKTIYDDTSAGGNSSGAVVNLRSDWGLPFEGALIIENHTIRNNVTNLPSLALVSFYAFSTIPHNQSRQATLGNIFVKNIILDNTKPTILTGIKIALNQYTSSFFTKKIFFKDVLVNNESDTNYFQAVDYVANDDFLKSFDISVDNVITKILNGYKTGFVLSDFANNASLLKTSKKLIFINAPTSNTIFKITINDAEGNVFINAKNDIAIKNSTINCLYLGATLCQSLIVDNSFLYPVSSNTGYSTIIPCHKAVMKNNIIQGIKNDGVYQGVNLENIATSRLIYNNYLIGKPESSIATQLKSTVSTEFVS